jgi:NADH dehydrogenase
MDNLFVLVLGGSGFIGRHVVAQLSEAGHRVIVPTRHFQRARDLLVFPGIDDVVEADIHDDEALNRLVSGMDAVINLVGILHSRAASGGQRYGDDFLRVHVELPRRVVTACAVHGVRRYLHMSALGADPQGPSMYLRSKGDGESAALSNPAVAVTIFRPSVVFGEEDHFLNRFAAMQKWLPVIPLACEDAKFQPVYVGDVARAIAAALDDEATIGHVYPLVGPRVYTLRELVRLAGLYSGHLRPIFGLPSSAARIQAWLLEQLPGEPLMSRDNLDSMKVDNIAGFPGIPELGIAPTELESVAPVYLS